MSKTRTITIMLNEVYRDIDDLTYKYAEVSDVPSPSVKNGMTSDTTDHLDGLLLARAVDYRDAKLRAWIGRFLGEERMDGVVNTLISKDRIVYRLNLEDTFQDALLRPICSMIHRYLVFGALFDWYGPGMGSRQAQNYSSELDSLEQDIMDELNSDVTIVQKTKQPFANRTYQDYGIYD